MSDTLGSAYVDIVARTKEFPGQVKKGLDNAGKDIDTAARSHGDRYSRGLGARLASSLGGVGKAAGVALAGGLGLAAVGVGAALKVGFGEVKDYQEGFSQLTAGIKSTGGAAGVTAPQLEDLASKIQNYSGQTDDSIVASEKLLLTFTNIKNSGTNRVFDEATKASADLAARMGGDASASAIQLGKALNDPIKGVTALTRIGVSFSEEQKKTIAAMVKTGDVAGAQKVILGELNKEFGGSAEAFGKTLPGQMAIAHRAFEDISQSLVSGLLPTIVGVGHVVTNDLLPAFGKVAGVVGDELGPVFAKAGAIVASLKLSFDLAGFRGVILMVDSLTGSGGRLTSTYDAVTKFVRDTLLPALSDTGAFIKNTLLPTIGNLAQAIAPALLNPLKSLIETGFHVLKATLDIVGPALKAVTGFFKDHEGATRALAATITALLIVTKLHAAFLAVEAVGGLSAYLKQTNLVEAATKVWTAAQWLLNAALDANPLGLAVIAIAALVAGMVIAYKNSETFRTIVKGAFDAVATAVGWVVDKLGDAFGLLGHVPGFGWAKTAAASLHGAADAARDLGEKVKGIPEYKHIKVDLAVNGINTLAGVTAKLDRLDGARATGGPVRAGGAYLVGENGPELLVPAFDGTIVPNDRLGTASSRGTASGRSVTIEHLNVTAPVNSPYAIARATELALQMAL